MTDKLYRIEIIQPRHGLIHVGVAGRKIGEAKLIGKGRREAFAYAGEKMLLSWFSDEGWKLDYFAVIIHSNGIETRMRDDTFTMPESDIDITALFVPDKKTWEHVD